MYLVSHSRNQLLQALPAGAAVCEIGVHLGDFSAAILEACQPRQLTLIDPWCYQPDAAYQNDPANVPQAQADEKYRQVSARFAAEIAAGKVVLRRDFSTQAAKTMAAASFDWIYVDARHDHDAVLEDLRAFDPLVRDDGFICGHDFCRHVIAKEYGFGVVEAVRRFLDQTGYQLVAMTPDQFPSYVIAKRLDSQAYRDFEARLLMNFPWVVEIRDFWQRGFDHRLFALSEKSWRLVLTV